MTRKPVILDDSSEPFISVDVNVHVMATL